MLTMFATHPLPSSLPEQNSSEKYQNAMNGQKQLIYHPNLEPGTLSWVHEEDATQNATGLVPQTRCRRSMPSKRVHDCAIRPETDTGRATMHEPDPPTQQHDDYRVQSSAYRTSAATFETDWQRIKPILENLYIDQDKSLKDTMQHLRLKHQFTATTMQYKKRINQWGLIKNLKQHEVEQILGIQAQRKATGKLTEFTLRGRKVDMQEVYRYQRRKKLSTSTAISNYISRSKPCHHLRPFTPQPVKQFAAPDPYESTLLAFSALFAGLVDSKYYWLDAGEIVMPQSALRGEVSDLCCSLVASKAAGFNPILVRKLALLLEQILHSVDAWTHCRLIYMMWVLSTGGHTAIVDSLLRHLRALVAGYVDVPGPQYQFVSRYSALEAGGAAKFAADIITIKADMVGRFRVEDAEIFRVRSLEYDVFWREREQGTRMSSGRAVGFFKRCRELLGLFAVETLTVLKIVLEDFGDVELVLEGSLQILAGTNLVSFDKDMGTFVFDSVTLSMEAAAELAHIYCLLGLHDTEAWMVDVILSHQVRSMTYLRREHGLVVRASQCSRLMENVALENWVRRKQEMESRWLAEVDAAASAEESQS